MRLGRAGVGWEGQGLGQEGVGWTQGVGLGEETGVVKCGQSGGSYRGVGVV